MKQEKILLRGDIYWVALDPALGTEIKKRRPAIIISNDAINNFLSRVIIAPITSKVEKIYPSEVEIVLKEKNGKVLLDQIHSVDKDRIQNKIGSCSLLTMIKIDH